MGGVNDKRFFSDSWKTGKLANWLTAPYNRWSFQHVRRLVPTAGINRGNGPVCQFEHRRINLDQIEFTGADDKTLTIAKLLSDTYTDGFLVLKDGEIINEQYFNGMKPETRHIIWSVSKSMVGSLAGILIQRNILDTDAKVADFIPELEESAFYDASVRQLLDMTVGVDYSEDYNDPESDVIRMRDAVGYTPKASNYDPSTGLYGFLATLKKKGEHGQAFHYCSACTNVLGWVMERVCRTSFFDLLTNMIWSRLGAEFNAYINLDKFGNPMASGGVCATIRDLARFGQMHLQNGFYNENQIIPAEWIADTVTNGSREAWTKGDFAEFLPEGCYRNQWYNLTNDHGSYFAAGVHGQHIYIDPFAKIVIVKLSSMPSARDDKLVLNTFLCCRFRRHTYQSGGK